MTILVIEDDSKLIDILEKTLRQERFAFDIAHDGETGLEKALKGKYSLILLDMSLPNKSGLSVCEELRAKSIHTPIVMISSESRVEDVVAGLDSGADDYLIKPLNMKVLFARIRAVLRRNTLVDTPVLSISDLIIDGKKHLVTREGRALPLTPKEYRLLGTLVRHKGQAVTRKQLTTDAWGPEFVESNNELNVHIRYLRNKVDGGRTYPLIKTVRGVGYTLRENY